MKSIKILLAATALFAVANLSAQTVNDVNAKYNEAATLIQAKKYQEAIPVLEATMNMGLEAGAEAAATVTQAQKLIPTCYFQYALSLARENKFEEALPVLDKAAMYAELYQDSKVLGNTRKLMSQTYTALGAVPFNTKEWDKAIAIFSKGYAANPTDAELGLFLAESYAESGDFDNAMKVYNEIAVLEARSARYAEASAKAKDKISYYQLHMASDAAQKGDTQKAYVLIQEMLTVNPANAEANLLRVQLAANAQDWAKVIEWGNAAADAQTDAALKSTVYYLMGAANQNSTNKDAAIANYRKVVAGPNAAEAKKQIDVLSAIK